MASAVRTSAAAHVVLILVVPTFLVLVSVVLVSVLLAWASTPAQAHRLQVFALAQGHQVRGYVYFGGNVRARGASVQVMGPDGTILFATNTGDDGSFAFLAGARIDHRIVADLGDGHRAEFTLPAARLPPSLPVSPAMATPIFSPAGGDGEASRQQIPGETVDMERATTPSLSPASIETMIDETVARHVAPLREQLVAYEAQVRWRDVLGGIGYIAGVVGVAAWFLGRRDSRGG